MTKLHLPDDEPRQRLAACGKWLPPWHRRLPTVLRFESLRRRQEWAKSATEARMLRLEQEDAA